MLVCAFTSAFGVIPLFAQTNDTLADLVANSKTLTIGDKTFSNFSFTSNNLTSFDPSQIQVGASIGADGTYDLTWSGNVSLATLATATADLKLNYEVTASAGTIYMIDQAYTGSEVNGLLLINESVSQGGFSVAPFDGYSQLNNYDVSDPPAESNDLLNLTTPAAQLYVTKDIALAGFTPGGFVSVSEVTQSFHQVPEPSTLALAGLSGLSLLLFRRQRK